MRDWGAALDRRIGSRGVNEVTFRDPESGVRARVDRVWVTTGQDGEVSVVARELKTGEARLSNNQRIVYAAIERGDAVPVGRNARAAGLVTGQPIGQQSSNIDMGLQRVPSMLEYQRSRYRQSGAQHDTTARQRQRPGRR